MPSSGTFNFNPAASDLVLTAFSRCGKSGAALTAEHLHQASNEANLLNVEWTNRGVNLWKSETIRFPSVGNFTQGIGQYVLSATTIAVQMCYVQIMVGGQPVNRVLGPLSNTEFAALPQPLSQGPPTSFWFDRQIIPTMNLWPVPDLSNTYTGFVRALTQIEDVVLPAGVTLNTPYRFFDAFVAGLAMRLAVHYAPERLGTSATPRTAGTGLTGLYERAWDDATRQDTEAVPMSIAPQLGSYYRI